MSLPDTLARQRRRHCQAPLQDDQRLGFHLPVLLNFFLPFSFFATLPVRALVYHIRADDCNTKPGAALCYLTYLTLPASSLL